MIVPSLAKAGLRPGILSGLPLPGASSVSTTVSPLRVLTVTGDDLVGEGAAGDRGLARGAAIRSSSRPALAGQLVFVGGVLRESAHRAARLVGIFQPVEEHVVVGGVVPDARARAVLLEEVGRVGHALHAARDDQVDRARWRALRRP